LIIFFSFLSIICKIIIDILQISIICKIKLASFRGGLNWTPSHGWLPNPRGVFFFPFFPFSFWMGGWSTVCIHFETPLVFFSCFLSSKKRGFLMSH
jgi:hypothetical protein